MSQTKRGSLTETLTNTVIGFAISYTANLYVLPLYGMHPNHGQALGMSIIFTVISIVRGYVLRRAFNRMNIFQA